MQKLSLFLILAATIYSCNPPIKKLGTNPKVGYYIVGRIQTKEINTGIPFQVKAINLNPKLIDELIWLNILSDTSFKLNYLVGDKKEVINGIFEKEINNKDMQLLISQDSLLDSSLIKHMKYITYGFTVKGE